MRDLEWFIPVGLIVSVELLLWWVAFVTGHAAAPTLVGSSAIVNSVFTVVVLVKLSLAVKRLLKSGNAHPVRSLLNRDNVIRALTTVAALQMLTVAASAFGALKAAIPNTNPFWLDVPLARWERATFLINPWQLSNLLFGWATRSMDAVYATYLPCETVALVLVVCTRPSDLKTRALVTIALCWTVLGIIGAYLLSSAGPLFYDRVYGGRTFAQLNDLVSNKAPITANVANMLWNAHAFGKNFTGNGISAMPSMHVAGALWIALVIRQTRLWPLGWLYYALIWLGSVQLGWHYFSDGLVATIGVVLLWRVSPIFSFKPKVLTRTYGSPQPI